MTKVNIHCTWPNDFVPLGHALHPHPGVFRVPEYYFFWRKSKSSLGSITATSLLIMCRKLERHFLYYFLFSLYSYVTQVHNRTVCWWSLARGSWDVCLDLWRIWKLLWHYHQVQVISQDFEFAIFWWIVVLQFLCLLWEINETKRHSIPEVLKDW
jgi:hypothetical protein